MSPLAPPHARPGRHGLTRLVLPGAALLALAVGSVPPAVLADELACGEHRYDLGELTLSAVYGDAYYAKIHVKMQKYLYRDGPLCPAYEAKVWALADRDGYEIEGAGGAGYDASFVNARLLNVDDYSRAQEWTDEYITGADDTSAATYVEGSFDGPQSYGTLWGYWYFENPVADTYKFRFAAHAIGGHDAEKAGCEFELTDLEGCNPTGGGNNGNNGGNNGGANGDPGNGGGSDWQLFRME